MGADMKKRLFDMQIDEVSLVDRPANQHGVISFSKNDEGDYDDDVVEFDELFDDNGGSVDLSEVQPGDEIVSDDGSVWVVTDDDGNVPIGKAAPANPGRWFRVKQSFQSGRSARKGPTPEPKEDFLNNVRDKPTLERSAAKAGYGYQSNPRAWNAAGIGAGAGTALAGGYALNKMDNEGESMSYTDEVLEELSKAVSDHERQEVIAKMATDLDHARQEAAQAVEFAKALEAQQIEEAFISKAASYNLPVDPEEFGPIIMKMASVLDDAEFELVDKVFAAVGDALYTELGYIGGADNASVLDTVDSLADELLAKSDGGFSKAEAVTAMLAANPDAYDAYLAENGR